MAGFENQGKFAASCEPFAEWCDANDIKLRVSECKGATAQGYNTIWNKALQSLAEGDFENADEYLHMLEQL